MKHNILVVDDNQNLCKNIMDILEFKGHKADAVFDGSQAIEAVKKGNYDIVIMDVKMPEINGIEAMKVIKGIVPHMVIIMITAFADDIFYKEGVQNENLEIIRKPINIDKFLRLLDKI